MTVDLATLSIKIDSTEAGRASGELDRLTQSGTRAEQTTDRMGREFVKASSAAGKLRMEEAAVRMETERLAREQLKAARSSEVLAQQSQRASTQMAVVTRSAGAQRAGMQQLSYQIGDVATMFALGARPMQIFASQSGQVVQAIQLMSGASRGFMGLLAGPWGIAVTSAVTVLGTLGMAYLSAGDDAEEAVSKLDTALARFRRGLAETSDLSNVMTEATRERVGLLAELAAEERKLASAEAARSIPGAAAQGVEAANRQAAAARERIEAINSEINSIDSRMQSAISEADLRNRLDREAAARADERAEAEERGTRATRSRTATISDAQKVLEQNKRTVDNYIERLDDEYARLTLSDEAYRAREVAKMRDIAATQGQIDAINDLVKKIGEENALRDQADARRANLEAEQRAIEKRTRIERDAQEELRRQQEEDFRDLANVYEDLFTGGIDNVWDVFRKQGLSAISQIAAQWTLALLSGNAMTPGQAAGQVLGGPNSPLGTIFSGMFPANDNGTWDKSAGTKQGGYGYFGGDPLASSASSLQSVLGSGAVGFGIGSVIGGIGSSVGGSSTGGSIGGAIGGAAGSIIPGVGTILGSAIGSILGSVVGGLLGGSQKGGVTIDGSSVISSFGKDKFQQNGLSAADSIFGTLAQIADALGGDLTSSGRVSIGERKGNIRVDPFGLGNTKTGKGAIDFGQDLEAAIAFAIQDLLTDGVLTGISQASQNLLRKGGDLEKQLEKALLIESVPKLLKERLDPLGAALDEIDEQFQKLADALREGGATAQQFADAERLYNLEREAAAEQLGQSASALQEYLDSLAFGSNSPLSVRSQLASARDSFAQYEQAILSGEAVDVNAFTSSAQTLLGLSRQANASSSGFFSDFDRIRMLTQMAIENVDSGALQDGSVVFAQQTASATQSIANMQEDTNALLRDIRDRLSGGATDVDYSWFIDNRSFG